MMEPKMGLPNHFEQSIIGLARQQQYLCWYCLFCLLSMHSSDMKLEKKQESVSNNLLFLMHFLADSMQQSILSTSQLQHGIKYELQEGGKWQIKNCRELYDQRMQHKSLYEPTELRNQDTVENGKCMKNLTLMSQTFCFSNDSYYITQIKSKKNLIYINEMW